jgi:phospholipid/cholesterol/gamma-HCH transport system permease protein
VAEEPSRARCELSTLGEAAVQLRLSGDWVVGGEIPAAGPFMAALPESGEARTVVFDTRELGQWDSLLLTFLVRIIDGCKAGGLVVDRSGLPAGVQGLLELAYAVPEREGVRRVRASPGIFEQIGSRVLAVAGDGLDTLAFVGEATRCWGRFLRGKARYRRSDLWLLLDECGPRALPIVTLISALTGLILAFVGAVQLQIFGAQVYIADLVGLGMAREMGAMMTGVIMAGRTGAAFAAQLGSMQVNSEIDALKTLGLSPMEFLVLPRMLALILMMPLLCLYSIFTGILGGALVSVAAFDLNLLEYFHHILLRLHVKDFSVGVGKAAVFGVLVAIAGCMRGMQCGRSSSAVGLAATSAVVTSIVFIVVSDAIMTFVLSLLKI